jgi:hypothetical protein
MLESTQISDSTSRDNNEECSVLSSKDQLKPGEDLIAVYESMKPKGDTYLQDLHLISNKEADFALNANIASCSADKFPYIDRLPGGKEQKGATVKLEATQKRGDNTLKVYSVDLNDGYFNDTKFSERILEDKSGTILKRTIRFEKGDESDIKFGNNIKDKGVALAKNVRQLVISNNRDGTYTVQVSPVQTSIVGGAASRWNTIQIARDGTIKGVSFKKR